MNQLGKTRKSSLIGLIILVVVMALIGVFSYMQSNRVADIVVNGFVGGEKIDFLENPKVQEILKKDFHITVNSKKAGSIDMVYADHTNIDFLWPSSQTAMELYRDKFGKPVKDEIIFNSPIVLCSHKLVLDAFVKNNMATVTDGVAFVDMQVLVKKLSDVTPWKDLGLPQLYGSLSIDTTDPTKSNSGNMFSALLANILNNGEVVSATTVNKVLPQLQAIIERLGYMETSSLDLFNQFLKTGVGSKPMIACYENQLLEFSKAHPDDWKTVSDDIVILYPSPTVWSTHIMIARNENGVRLIEALMDPRLQEIAWTDHGFRTGVYSVKNNDKTFNVPGIAKEITRIIQMPSWKVMDTIITGLQ